MDKLKTIQSHLDRSHSRFREAGHTDLLQVSNDARKTTQQNTNRAPAKAVQQDESTSTSLSQVKMHTLQAAEVEKNIVLNGRQICVISAVPNEKQAPHKGERGGTNSREQHNVAAQRVHPEHLEAAPP